MTEQAPAADEVAIDGTHPDSARSDSARSDSARSDSARSDSARSDSARSDSARSDSARSDSARSDSARSDSARSEGVVDLLGLLAYASLVAFFRLADDAALSTSLSDKADLAGMAVAQFGHFDLLRQRIAELGRDPQDAMRPFVEPVDAFHARTAPSDGLEGLVKAYVGDGIAADFYRMIAELLDPPDRSLVLKVLAISGHARFAITRVREAIEADPAVAGRLALWARRLLGEAVSQAQRVAADRKPLALLLAGGSPAQLGDIGRMFAALTDAHAQRMTALGLAE